MSIYTIDVHHRVHTCPGNPDPHPYDTRQTIVTVTPGGPCQAPVTIRSGDTVTTVDCRLHTPADRQCGPCRTTTWTRTTTITDLGFQHPTGITPAANGLAADPCPICHTPVAAFLGVHLLCQPRPVSAVAA